MMSNTCKRCGWEWYQRTPRPPAVCPKCKSPYWNKPRTKDMPWIPPARQRTKTVNQDLPKE